MSRLPGGIDPGVMPPTSAWCARDAVKNSSVRAIGAEHRRHDRHVRQVSAAGVRRIQQERIPRPQVGAVRVEHRRDARAHRTEMHGHVRRVGDEVGPASNIAQEKSSRSLMLTELAVWRSTTPICSATCMNNALNTSSRIGSGTMLPVCAWPGRVTTCVCGRGTAGACAASRCSTSMPLAAREPIQPGAIQLVAPASQSNNGPRIAVSCCSPARDRIGTVCHAPSNQVCVDESAASTACTAADCAAARSGRDTPAPWPARSPRP